MEPDKRNISMLGAFRAGKTSLVRRYIDSVFDEKYHATIGVKVDAKSLELGGKPVKLMLYDIAGPEERFPVPLSYVKKTQGYFLVIDGTRPETVDAALELGGRVEESCGPLPRVVLINKADLTAEWKLDDAALARLSPLDCPVLRTSAKTGENVEEAFRLLAERVFAPGDLA